MARFATLCDTLAELVQISNPDYHLRFDSLTIEAVDGRRQKLLGATGLRFIRDSDSLIYFPVWEDKSSGEAREYASKGYAYATRVPGVADSSLDISATPGKWSHAPTRYKRLEDSWFLFRHRGKIPGDPKS